MKLDSPIFAQAPANIALIKYMGKDDASVNLPANPSLSMTLDSLCTVVEISRMGAGNTGIRWIPEVPRKHPVISSGSQVQGMEPPMASDALVQRAVRHLERVERAVPELFSGVGLSHRKLGAVEVRSANTFPPSSGIASSASSFAALTLAGAAACAQDPEQFREKLEKDVEMKRALARLSRAGSGSSCRSFEGPWVLWQKEGAAEIMARDMPEMVDFVILVGSAPKPVTSSEAHARVTTSPLWERRAERVSERIANLESSLSEGDLAASARATWAEFWEMHSLFHTCSQPFTYWEPGTIQVLKVLEQFSREGVPPLVTMDAGPNVHMLVPKVHAQEWESRIARELPRFKVLRDNQGRGARLL